MNVSTKNPNFADLTTLSKEPMLVTNYDRSPGDNIGGDEKSKKKRSGEKSRSPKSDKKQKDK